MRYSSARQMIFDAYQTRRGNSPIAGLFDDLRRIREKTGNNGAKLRSLIAEHKRNVRALANADVNSPDIEQLKMAVRRTEQRLSEVRTALEDISKSSNEGHLPDNDWKIVHGLEAGAVMSRVESLPIHLQALARYCFGPFTRDELAEDAEHVHWALYSKLLTEGVKLPGQGKGLPTAEQLNTLKYLCAAALYHHSQVTWPYSRPGLPTPKAVQGFMLDEYGVEVEVRFWTRTDRSTWGAVWERILRVLDNWEAEALAPVADLLPQAA
ncbi:hypothetical protein [Litchfieldella xinjiangensis]|uniref:hypothetical protein n=1 Tax=Litchfieldella xinjiangensis TaxID=1166948 RepID=UPI0018CF4F1C|nr:hypothetical protein [Halomonas xinjiangensis]